MHLHALRGESMQSISFSFVNSGLISPGVSRFSVGEFGANLSS